jgi:flagellar FliJ protein
VAGAKKFIYRLQKVLDHRQRKEDLLKGELAAAIRTRDKEVALLNNMVERRTKAQKQLQANLARGDVSEIQFTNAFIEQMAQKLDAQNRTVAKANQSVEETRSKLTVAAKERKIMEKHKEKQHEEWKEEEKKAENKFINELATNIFHAKRRAADEAALEDQRYEENREKKKLMEALRAKNRKK